MESAVLGGRPHEVRSWCQGDGAQDTRYAVYGIDVGLLALRSAQTMIFSYPLDSENNMQTRCRPKDNNKAQKYRGTSGI
jgi:hypothetical protein